MQESNSPLAGTPAFGPGKPRQFLGTQPATHNCQQPIGCVRHLAMNERRPSASEEPDDYRWQAVAPRDSREQAFNPLRTSTDSARQGQHALRNLPTPVRRQTDYQQAQSTGPSRAANRERAETTFNCRGPAGTPPRVEEQPQPPPHRTKQSPVKSPTATGANSSNAVNTESNPCATSEYPAES
jgi:hypothetical protein